MRNRESRSEWIQLKLFHPSSKSRNSQLQNLPVEIQQQTMRMLAELLRQHCERVNASFDGKEAGDE
jgi:hypothetical protein